jgi:hypothetical protein
MKKQTIMVIVVLLVFCLITSSFAQQSTVYNFAYFTRNIYGDTPIQLTKVAVLDGKGTPLLGLGSLDYGNGFLNAKSSPDGNWVVFSTATDMGESSMLQLWNVTTFEIQAFLVEGASVFSDIPSLNDSVQWSPDSQMIAVAAGKSIIVYSLTAKSPLLITNEAAFYQRLAWSSDSRKLVTTAHHPLNNTNSLDKYTLDIFDVSTGNKIQELDLSFLSNILIPVCDLGWSPKGDYIQ